MTVVALQLLDDLAAALRIPAHHLAAEIAFAARLAERGLPTATFDAADLDAAR